MEPPGKPGRFSPPYWATEGYGVPFPLSEYEQLAEMMRTLTGHAVPTINDHPTMRKIFDGFPVREVPVAYTIGGARTRKSTRELIYTSWRA